MFYPAGKHWQFDRGDIVVRFLPAWIVIGWLAGCGGGTVAPVHQLGATAYGGPRPSYYIVRPGDTLYSIGWRYGVDYRKLAHWNGIGAPYTIYVGQKLRLRAPADSKRAARRPSSPPPKKVTDNTAKSRLSAEGATVSPPQEAKPSRSREAQTPANPVKVSHGIHWRWPTQGEVIQTFSAADPSRKGVDIAGQIGQPIVAAAEGKVIYSGIGPPRYSKLIIIKHENDFLSTYAHNHALISKEGDWVQRGQKIAEMGLGGASHRAKLHFEIRHKGQPVDPLRYLPAR